MGYAIFLLAILFAGALVNTEAENQYNHWEISSGLQKLQASPDRHMTGLPYCSAALVQYKEDCMLPIFLLIDTQAEEGHCMQKAYYGPSRPTTEPDAKVLENFHFWHAAKHLLGQWHSRITAAYSKCMGDLRAGEFAYRTFGFTQNSRQCHDCLRPDFLGILDGYLSPDGRSYERALYASIDYSPYDSVCPKLKF